MYYAVLSLNPAVTCPVSPGSTKSPAQHQYWTRSKSRKLKPSPAHIKTSPKQTNSSAEDVTDKDARLKLKRQKVQHFEKDTGPSLKRNNLSAAETGEL